MKKPKSIGPQTFQQSPITWSLVVFALVFSFCALGGEIARRHGLGWRGVSPEVPLAFKEGVLEESTLANPDFYYMLYQGIGKPIQSARQSDILLLGNSRLLFAIRDDSIRQFEEKTGLRVFNMALNRGDRYPLALDIIKRQGLHPALVVINDDDFFRPEWTEASLDTRRSDYWQGCFKITEHRLSWTARSFLHRWIPKFSFSQQNPSEPVFLLRSTETGAIVFENFPLKRYPIEKIPRMFFYRSVYLEGAWRFKSEMDRLGIKVVLTFVPKDDNSKIVAEVSRQLKVPMVLPKVGGLETFDRSHLTARSASRFAGVFFKELGKLKEVRSLARPHEKPSLPPASSPVQKGLN